MNFSTKNILSKENLLSKVTSYQIFTAYCKNFIEVGKAFKSEFRDEKSPSCMIEHLGGDLLYTDFGEGSYRALEYVMRKFNISFHDAIRRINCDLNVGLIDEQDKFGKFTPYPVRRTKTNPNFIPKSTTEIEVRYAPYRDEDIEYWSQYGWTEEMLMRASIRPIDFYWITMEHKGFERKPFSALHELAYTYDYYRHNGIYRRKLYFPERDSDHKWISNVDPTIIQNWDLLPKNGGDLLFITSSKKDTGPFWRLNGHYCNAVAPNNEGTCIIEKVFYAKIKPRWKRIILWYDNDEPGILNAIKWSKKYQIEAVWNPIGAPKDPSDYTKAHGLREFNYLKNKLIM